MSLAEKFEVIADAVYEKGKNDDKSDFWDVFQNKGIQMANYQYAFAYGHFSDENYNPKHKINPSYSCSNMFYSATKITDTKVDIDVRLATASTNVFRLASKLKTIRKIIVNESNTFVQWFTGCSSLENITFEGVIGNDLSFADSPLLTAESLVGKVATEEQIADGKNIIELNGTHYYGGILIALRDNSTTGVTNTLTLHKDAKAKLTDAQKALATEKGWTLA
jgi:hypothetical protein